MNYVENWEEREIKVICKSKDFKIVSELLQWVVKRSRETDRYF